MASNHAPLHVMVVSPDMPLLRELARVLETVECEVQTSKDRDSSACGGGMRCPI